MVEGPGERLAEWLAGLRRRSALRHAAMLPVSPGLSLEPEPRTIGSMERGRQLISGTFRMGGHLVEGPDPKIWALPAAEAEFDEDRHGFTWLDDLAALGSIGARMLAQRWTADWIETFSRATGPCWRPDIAGRRLSRWINHAVFLTSGKDGGIAAPLYIAMSRHTHFLGRQAAKAAPGLPRIEALGGLIQATLTLGGMTDYREPAIEALAQECDRTVDDEGGIPSRNPAELLEIFATLTFVASMLSEAGKIVPRSHQAAIQRIAPRLRVLRHVDGGLARFHGGGRGIEGRLDHALAVSGIRRTSPDGRSMGFVRLCCGRTSVIVDAAPPPTGPVSARAHASTLAFEMTRGQDPVIVGCGAGEVYGPAWARAGRSTASHSVLTVEGTSSSRFEKRITRGRPGADLIAAGPSEVTVERVANDEAIGLHLAHDGYLQSHGLVHARALHLGHEGLFLDGSDEVRAPDDAARKVMDQRRADKSGGGALHFAIRFHLHPGVEPVVRRDGVRLILPWAEVWHFSHRGGAALTVEPSLYLEKNRLEPRATKQIVLSGALIEYAARINWRLARIEV